MTSAGVDWQREKWQSGFGSKFIRQGEKNAVKYADEIIVLSKGVQDYFKETYGRETHFIPNGVNLDVAIRKEPVNIDDYDALTDHDKKFYELAILLEAPMRLFNVGLDIQAPISEKELLNVLTDGEKRLQELIETQTDDRLGFDGVHTSFANLYTRKTEIIFLNLRPCGCGYKISSTRFYNRTIVLYQTIIYLFLFHSPKSLPVKFQQKNSRGEHRQSSY